MRLLKSRAAGCSVLSAAPGNVSVSRNLGASAATGNVLAFVDADCELPENWLIQCGQELQRTGVVAFAMQMAAPAVDAAWVERTWYELAHRSTASESKEDVTWLPTFNLAVHADRFRDAGGFDDGLITCEDVDLGISTVRIGRLRMIREGGVVHHGEARRWPCSFAVSHGEHVAAGGCCITTGEAFGSGELLHPVYRLPVADRRSGGGGVATICGRIRFNAAVVYGVETTPTVADGAPGTWIAYSLFCGALSWHVASGRSGRAYSGVQDSSSRIACSIAGQQAHHVIDSAGLERRSIFAERRNSGRLRVPEWLHEDSGRISQRAEGFLHHGGDGVRQDSQSPRVRCNCRL